MLKIVENEAVREEGYTLDALAREGARRMLMSALEEEVAAYVERHAEARNGEGRRLVVRNGQARARGITCGAGTLEVRAPRVNDRRVGEEGERCRFASRILPPYMRRSPKVAEVLPVLYLRLFRTICGWLRACEGMGACGLVDNIRVTHRAHRPSWGSVDNVPVAHRSPALQEM